MIIGYAAEFRLFSDQPYGLPGNVRSLSWTASSIGSLIQDIGATVLGVAIWRSGIWPHWSGLLFMLALPLDVVGFIALSPFFASAILAIGLGYLLLTAAHSIGEVEAAGNH